MRDHDVRSMCIEQAATCLALRKAEKPSERLVRQKQPSQDEGSTSIEGRPSLQSQGDPPLGACQ